MLQLGKTAMQIAKNKEPAFFLPHIHTILILSSDLDS